jgi:hypothetical protein
MPGSLPLETLASFHSLLPQAGEPKVGATQKQIAFLTHRCALAFRRKEEKAIRVARQD